MQRVMSRLRSNVGAADFILYLPKINKIVFLKKHVALRLSGISVIPHMFLIWIIPLNTVLTRSSILDFHVQFSQNLFSEHLEFQKKKKNLYIQELWEYNSGMPGNT